MKLRTDGNSIRLRLSRTEVARFAETGLIEETVEFAPTSKFTYRLTATDTFTINCLHDLNGILVQVPRDLAQDWANTNQVSLSAEQNAGTHKTLQILIEKDFQCLHKDSDANADAYPNPLASLQT